jgi:hypothetical protein
MNRRLWRWIVRRFGGDYQIGAWGLTIHDDGFWLDKNSVIVIDKAWWPLPSWHPREVGPKGG